MAKKEERTTLGLDADDEVVGAMPEAAATSATPANQVENAKPATKVERRGRVRDAHRPNCPNCSTEEKIVRCTATSSRDLFTWYACDNECGYRVKIPRPELNRRGPQRLDLSHR